MVDHIKALGYKVTFFKAVVFFFGLLFFLWLLPVDELNILRDADFESIVIGSWLLISGSWFVIEGMASTPEAKKGTSKAGLFALLALGFIGFTFGVGSIVFGIDLIKDNLEIRYATLIVLGGSTGLFFVTMFPEVFKRTSFIKALNG